MKIGLLSDTHSFLDKNIFKYFENCDEIWHAGDIGDMSVIEKLEEFRPLRAVFGNIDDTPMRIKFPEDDRFICEGMDIWLTHIGGYPGRYDRRVRTAINANPPDVFICGHSHILKVMPDKKNGLLHINPGACGFHGFHKVRTIIRFDIENGRIDNLEVVELGLRTSVS